jgi:hypothetical protein
MVKAEGHPVACFLMMGLVGAAVACVLTRPLLAAKRVTAQAALETLRICPDPLSDGRHKRFMDGLSLLTAEQLNEVLIVASGAGPVSCRGLALVVAGEIAAKDPSTAAKVLRAVTPYLSHPDLWQAAIQAIVPIGLFANDQLMSLLDAQDESTWKGVIVILQRINHSRLPEGSELRSAEFPDTAEGRAQLTALWRRWWQNAQK